MSTELIIVLVIVVWVTIGSLLRGKRRPYFQLRQRAFPYRKRVSVLGRSEAAFFMEMQRQLPQGFYLFPKVRIIDFLDVTDGRRYSIWKRHIWAKHVDFLICDLNFNPVVAIEINGKSHLAPDRIARDRFVNNAFQAAQMRLETVEVGSSFALSAQRVAARLVSSIY